MIGQRSFPMALTSVRQSRAFVAEQLGDLPAALLQDVQLMVSELASNSIRHAGSPFTVGIDRTVDSIRIEVADRGAGSPALRVPNPREPSGRGLQIVDRLAADWGVTSSPGGKAVWFVIPAP